MKKSNHIKIFEAKINSSNSFDEILKICNAIKNTTTIQGNDVEKVFYTFIRVSRDVIPNKTEKAYEIIFNSGKLMSVEYWDINVVYSTVPKKGYQKHTVLSAPPSSSFLIIKSYHRIQSPVIPRLFSLLMNVKVISRIMISCRNNISYKKA